ncbi:MAG: hypothetical protein QOD06_2719 [Candidatus Binatota bacterium]|nr:hypothetical protein [Candidatus Binatota bacterium]
MDTRTVHFYSEGSKLEGEIFSTGGPGRRPGIVLAHGFTGLRSLILPDYAKVFAEAGFVALAFDYRGFGGSEGPKWRIDPLEQIDDIRNAITFLAEQPEVDAARIGVWGTSYGGGHAPYVAAIDPRVKAAVGQVGFGDGEKFLMEVRPPERQAELRRTIAEDRRQRVLTGKGTTANAIDMLGGAQTREFLGPAFETMPELRCQISWETAEKTLEYKPVQVVHRIAPRALLLIGAEHDDLCKISQYAELCDRAGEPKKLVRLPITHYEVYAGKWLEESARLATDWFRRHL